jgi:pyruvate formate lyase activating enzyme
VAKTIVKCRCCGKESVLISQCLGLCAECIKNRFAELRPAVEGVHHEEREGFGLPKEPPREEKGLRCRICINECSIPEAGRSYCGLRVNIGGRLSGAVGQRGNASWYHDPLPTNCVADWVCPGGTGAGYPRFAYRSGPEFGYNNLAVFYQACSFDCLFCQNWHYRLSATAAPRVSAQTLAHQVDEKTSCICYFGGDPTPQLPHAILASRLALNQAKDRVLRICWETNGSMHPNLLRQMAELSLKSGGCIKFDLKAWSEELHLALCGVSNKRTLENFRLLAQYIERRPQPPLLVASTLLIPGYVETEEVARIATFIASLNPEIPYALLAFHPHFLMSDLPTTSRRHAQECLQVAREAGLSNVRVGNIHLLGGDYYRDGWHAAQG